ncbi:hypothetical protein DL770_005340 [Monosporascus sp. CRB-9-2]|nr:hypothetical protein DL770_005340 [Monosporascus sp. CRB-9-2]
MVPASSTRSKAALTTLAPALFLSKQMTIDYRAADDDDGTDGPEKKRASIEARRGAAGAGRVGAARAPRADGVP